MRNFCTWDAHNRPGSFLLTVCRNSKMLTEFIFNRYDTIGANAAEEDVDYLSECFVDMEELPVIKEERDPRFLVIGRTGSGKTALFMQLAEDCDNCYPIDANAKGFCFTERISILEELTDKGINLAPYLKLLWTHVLVIEIIQETIPVEYKDTIIDRLKSIFNRKGKIKEEKALRYLEEYQGHFWMETTERLRLITEKFTQEIKNITGFEAETKAKLGFSLSAGIGGSYANDETASYTREITCEVEQRGIETICQNFANDISSISNVIDALLQDKGRIMYVAIDKLDESVISDNFRYQSLRGLIDAIRDLNRDVGKLKIVVSLRTDLLDCILKKIKNPGQQYEKYKSLFLQIRWNRQQLIDLAVKRVNKLVRKRYQPKQTVSLRELFEKVHVTDNKVVSFEDYIIERSWNRPRDIIDFVNFCIKQAEGNKKVTQEMIRRAEKQYSKDRYSSLQEEWQKTIPEIKILLDLLAGLAVEFNVSSIDEDKTIDWAHAVLRSEELSSPLYCLALEYDNQLVNYTTFRDMCLQLLYDAGAIGIKFSPSDPLRWSYQEDYAYLKDDIHESSSVKIHPGLWAYYGICE